MSGIRAIPEAIISRQTQASDPEVSAFVSANAGSGKTHVLAQRVIRLLLNGTDPAKILCLTFTKAAAANMATRVFDTLRKWTALRDEELAARMRETGAVTVTPAALARARRLFAEAIETPGGLKVQTIHAFCARLLHQFPFEANVAARFSVLDERSELELLERESLAVLLDAAATPETALGRALSLAIASAADTTIRDLIGEAIRKRDKALRWIEEAGGLPQAAAALSRTLGLEPDETLDRIEMQIIEGPILPPSDWARAAELCASGSKRDAEQCERLRAAAAAAGLEKANLYLSAFFTTKMEPRKSLLTKALAATHPDLADRFAREQARLEKLLERRRAAEIRDRSMALLAIVHAAVGRYRAEKDRRGLLDYDDLIARTLQLLDPRAMSWVHYKLDYGIDHVLIDEAQDTSPEQWEIVKRLVSEFAAGAGVRGLRKRTVFAVGDEKQSIFSFQGAAPHEFERMRKEFAKAFDRPEFGWRYVQFDYSFRSGANVLGAVDAVFSEPGLVASITSDKAGILRHVSLKEKAPGLVELWKLEKADDAQEMEGWDAPFDALSVTAPQVKLARRIARRAKALTTSGIPAGHILVLVRQRGPLFEAIIRALKNAGVDVAGADRLRLTEHIAVEDLMALGDALLLPHDDLALAVALKSPFFGFDEDMLFGAAWDRSGTLREALKDRHPDIAALLDTLGGIARTQTPFAFYAHLLGPQRGRHKILARLGMEAADALDEFLNLALEYESREAPTLQGFLSWMRAAQTEIKRDMDIARDEVRVMTVHGAKGLEAPVVILADTTTRPEGVHPRLLQLPLAGAAPGKSAAAIWAGAKQGDVGTTAAARQAALAEAENEYRRLLYVAMTRAAEHLIVCGFEGVRAAPERCWYNLVFNALREDLVEEDHGEGPVYFFRDAVKASPVSAATMASAPDTALPEWLERDAGAEPPRPIPLIPSRSEEEPAATPGAYAVTRDTARARGILIHRLLQSLPDIPSAQRSEAANHWLKRANGLDDAARAEITAQVFDILHNPAFAPLFAPGSRAEIPIAGRIARRGTLPDWRVSGQIDRLCVTNHEILIADYKSNRPAPHTVRETVERYPGYIRQLALYRAVLGHIYPRHGFRAALIWTDGAKMMEIPANLLDAEFAGLTSA